MKTLLAVLALLPLSLHAAPARITGKVADAGGRAVPNAQVYVYTAQPLRGVSAICPSCYRDCGKHQAATARGDFRIDQLDPKLKFRLLAVAPGYEPKFSEYAAAGSKVDFALEKRAAADENRLVRGRVVDPDGKPVIGAVVERHAVRTSRVVGYGAIPGVDPLSITDGNGEFQLRIPDPAMKLDVRVRARNFAPEIARRLEPNKPQTITVDIGAAVSGRVTNDGRPVAGVVMGFVQKMRASESWLGADEIATDETGRFVMTGLGPNEEYIVYAKMASAAPLAVPDAIVKTGADATSADAGTLAAAKGHRVRGRVKADGRIPDGTRVLLARDASTDALIAEVGPNGEFAFDGVPRETVKLTLRAPGYRVPPQDVLPDDDVDDVTFVLRK